MPTWTMTARCPGEKLNLNDRRHFWQENKLKTVWKEHAWAMALRHPRPQITGLATVQVDFGVTDPGRRRDPSNWQPTQKVIIDALTHARFWPDDDSEHVHELTPRFVKSTIPTYTVWILWKDPDDRPAA